LKYFVVDSCGSSGNSNVKSSSDGIGGIAEVTPVSGFDINTATVHTVMVSSSFDNFIRDQIDLSDGTANGA
jgi:hypothetical protein